VAVGELVDNVAGVGQRACEPVEFRGHQRVALATGRQGLAQPRTVSVGTGQSVVDLDAPGAHAKRRQRLPCTVRSCWSAKLARSQSRAVPWVLRALELAQPGGRGRPNRCCRQAPRWRQRCFGELLARADAATSCLTRRQTLGLAAWPRLSVSVPGRGTATRSVAET
jgi:hypothetical protein